jgi:hypothetical protein
LQQVYTPHISVAGNKEKAGIGACSPSKMEQNSPLKLVNTSAHGNAIYNTDFSI